jgi:hypothetical protein
MVNMLAGVVRIKVFQGYLLAGFHQKFLHLHGYSIYQNPFTAAIQPESLSVLMLYEAPGV